MGKINAFLRSVEGGAHGHWCPGCKEMHVIPSSWGFDGNVESPTFTPSVKITGKKTINDERGEWTGEWAVDADGKAIDSCCHYILTAGQLQFCSDCTHEFSGQTVPLPPLPAWMD